MSRLIDADALIKTIENVCCKPCKEQKRDYNGVKCRACQYGDEIDDIDSFHQFINNHIRQRGKTNVDSVQKGWNDGDVD